MMIVDLYTYLFIYVQYVIYLFSDFIYSLTFVPFLK